MLYGIDVSSHQGNIYWDRVKKSGIDFAILRCHQKYGVDTAFEKNYSGCVHNAIPVGVYKYAYALSVSEANADADAVLSVLKGKKIEYPVFYDLEYSALGSKSVATIEAIAKAFLLKVEAAGYPVGIYCNKSWYGNRISPGLKAKYDFWIASYPSNDTGKIEDRLKPSYGVGWQYSEKGKVDGITGNVDMDVFYKDYSFEEGEVILPSEEVVVIDPMTKADEVLRIARMDIGKNQFNGSHKDIIDTYNAHSPLARGYRVTYTDSWCDTFVSYLFIKANAVDLIGGTECGVEEHTKKFKAKGIWIEDGTITPIPGDIIVFNWDQNSQPNDGYADHIGIVEGASGGWIVTIEGNAKGYVARRSYRIGDGNIRGFARPRYTAVQKSITDYANEVIRGLWGNGEERKRRLQEAGVDYNAVQAEVNRMLK